MEKRISIVLPTYNGEKVIKKSIESVLSQTYVNWELIIVNDCSTDNTLNVIESYEQSDPRIQVINNNTNQITDYNDRIGRYESMLAKEESQMRAMYARFEKLMSELQNSANSLTSLI